MKIVVDPKLVEYLKSKGQDSIRVWMNVLRT